MDRCQPHKVKTRRSTTRNAKTEAKLSLTHALHPTPLTSNTPFKQNQSKIPNTYPAQLTRTEEWMSGNEGCERMRVGSRARWRWQVSTVAVLIVHQRQLVGHNV